MSDVAAATWMVPPPGFALIRQDQIASVSAAVGLGTPPTKAVMAFVSPEAGNVRWRADGTDPTASVGMPLYATAGLWVAASLITSIKFIDMTGSTAKLNVAWFGGQS